jgi:hypothetical protein
MTDIYDEIHKCLISIGVYENENETNEDIKHFKWFYLQYEKSFGTIEKQISVFINCCELMNVENIKWLHNKLKLFNNSSDKLYLKCIKASCRGFNMSVAEWLADLYDEYEVKIINEDFMDFENIYMTYEKLSSEQTLYKKISKGIISDHEKYEILKINKFMDVGDEIGSCCICLDEPTDLIKLGCGHFNCVTCLCTWFMSNDKIALVVSYQYNGINVKRHYHFNVIMENIENQILKLIMLK